MSKILESEDYNEPRCLLCMDDEKDGKPKNTVPINRVIEKADEYFSRNDYIGAEKHFLYWLSEAYSYGDLRGAFSITNELMGLYRKTGKKEEALKKIEETDDLIEKLGIADSVSGGTAYVNQATVYKSFGMSDKAYPIFKKALVIYERDLSEGDGRLGGLYNNMALTLTDLKEYEEAKK